MVKNVAVIGVGGSGLASIKACLEENLNVVGFEKQSTFGGLWRYREDDEYGIASVMKSTVVNTSKEMSAFSDFPPSMEISNYMHNTQMFSYLEMYAKKFHLMKHIRFGHLVINVTQAINYEKTGRIKIKYRNLHNGVEKEEIFDGVMVCSGHHTYPKIPDFPGIDSFQGMVLHSHSYKKPHSFENKKVVIIGIGNSGVDIAVELSTISEKVYLSTRSGSWIFPILGPNGVPNDADFNRRSYNIFRVPILSYFFSKYYEYRLNIKFDHTLYKLKPKHRVFTQPITVNEYLPGKIISGSVSIKTDVHHFTPNGVVFVEEKNKVYPCDTIILATGYRIQFPFVDEILLKKEGHECELYKNIFPSHLKHFTMGFIGLIQPSGSIFPISESQARWFACLLSGQVSFPDENQIQNEIQGRSKIFKNRSFYSSRHAIGVNYISYMDDITYQFGSKPNLFKMFFKDSKLFLAVFNGPCLPYQYRLEGPGSWDGARNAILTYEKRVTAPFNSKFKKSSFKFTKIFYGVVVISFLCLVFLFISTNYLKTM